MEGLYRSVGSVAHHPEAKGDFIDRKCGNRGSNTGFKG